MFSLLKEANEWLEHVTAQLLIPYISILLPREAQQISQAIYGESCQCWIFCQKGKVMVTGHQVTYMPMNNQANYLVYDILAETLKQTSATDYNDDSAWGIIKTWSL